MVYVVTFKNIVTVYNMQIEMVSKCIFCFLMSITQYCTTRLNVKLRIIKMTFAGNVLSMYNVYLKCIL